MKGADRRIAKAEDRFIEKLRLSEEKRKRPKRKRRKRGFKKKKVYRDNKKVAKGFFDKTKRRLVATINFVEIQDPSFISRSALQA